MFNKILIISLYLVLYSGINAQNNSYFNDFFENSNYNSSYNTLNRGLKVSLLGYKSFNTPSSLGYFSLNSSYTNKGLLNLGVRIINKSLQFQSYSQADAIIGHRLAVSKNDSIALSLNFGGALNSFNSSFINEYTEIDPYVDQYNRSYFTTGSSFLYTHKNKLELGVASPILANTIDGLKPVMFFNAAYNFQDNGFTIKPQLLYNLNHYSNYFDMSMQLKYHAKYWAKFSYNTLKSSTFGVGMTLKLIDIGYAYKLNSNNFGRVQNDLHMITVSIRH